MPQNISQKQQGKKGARVGEGANAAFKREFYSVSELLELQIEENEQGIEQRARITLPPPDPVRTAIRLQLKSGECEFASLRGQPRNSPKQAGENQNSIIEDKEESIDVNKLDMNDLLTQPLESTFEEVDESSQPAEALCRSQSEQQVKTEKLQQQEKDKDFFTLTPPQECQRRAIQYRAEEEQKKPSARSGWPSSNRPSSDGPSSFKSRPPPPYLGRKNQGCPQTLVGRYISNSAFKISAEPSKSRFAGQTLQEKLDANRIVEAADEEEKKPDQPSCQEAVRPADRSHPARQSRDRPCANSNHKNEADAQIHPEENPPQVQATSASADHPEQQSKSKSQTSKQDDEEESEQTLISLTASEESAFLRQTQSQHPSQPPCQPPRQPPEEPVKMSQQSEDDSITEAKSSQDLLEKMLIKCLQTQSSSSQQQADQGSKKKEVYGEAEEQKMMKESACDQLKGRRYLKRKSKQAIFQGQKAPKEGGTQQMPIKVQPLASVPNLCIPKRKSSTSSSDKAKRRKKRISSKITQEASDNAILASNRRPQDPPPRVPMFSRKTSTSELPATLDRDDNRKTSRKVPRPTEEQISFAGLNNEEQAIVLFAIDQRKQEERREEQKVKESLEIKSHFVEPKSPKDLFRHREGRSPKTALSISPRFHLQQQKQRHFHQGSETSRPQQSSMIPANRGSSAAVTCLFQDPSLSRREQQQPPAPQQEKRQVIPPSYYSRHNQRTSQYQDPPEEPIEESVHEDASSGSQSSFNIDSRYDKVKPPQTQKEKQLPRPHHEVEEEEDQELSDEEEEKEEGEETPRRSQSKLYDRLQAILDKMTLEGNLNLSERFFDEQGNFKTSRVRDFSFWMNEEGITLPAKRWSKQISNN